MPWILSRLGPTPNFRLGRVISVYPESLSWGRKSVLLWSSRGSWGAQPLTLVASELVCHPPRHAHRPSPFSSSFNCHLAPSVGILTTRPRGMEAPIMVQWAWDSLNHDGNRLCPVLLKACVCPALGFVSAPGHTSLSQSSPPLTENFTVYRSGGDVRIYSAPNGAFQTVRVTLFGSGG